MGSDWGHKFIMRRKNSMLDCESMGSKMTPQSERKKRKIEAYLVPKIEAYAAKNGLSFSRAVNEILKNGLSSGPKEISD